MSLEEFGISSYRNRVRKFARIEKFTGTGIMWDGANGDIDQPDYQGWLESEQLVTCVSDSAEDAVGGSGAYALQITGQGEDGIEKVENVILTGEDAVDSEGKFITVYRAQVINMDAITNGNTSPITGDNGAANIGLVTIVSKPEPTRVMAAIIPGLGRTQMAIWRCPKNKYGQFTKIGVYPESGKPIVAQLFARGSINESWINVGQFDQDGFLAEPEWPVGLEEYIAPGTDLCLVVKAAQATNATSLLWVRLFDIPRYNELLLEESLP